MKHRRAALAIILSHTVIAGCATTSQTFREKPLFLQQDQYFESSLIVPVNEQVELQEQSQNDPSAGEMLDGGWTAIESGQVDPQIDQAQQNLALAMASTDGEARYEYLALAASLGSSDAHYELAKVFTEGVYRPRDLNKAQEHLLTAASMDHPEATRVLGWQMIKGQGGIEQNLNGGVAVMEVHAAKSVRTQRELGSLYSNLYSDYQMNNPAKGEEYLISAYKAGDALAAAALGKLYVQQGREAEAVEPLSFAKENKEPTSTKLLAALKVTPSTSQLEGDETGNNSETYYQRASTIMVRPHTADDEARAYALFSLAADSGHNLARVELDAISGVKVVMDKKHGTGWLDAEKQSVLNTRYQ